MTKRVKNTKKKNSNFPNYKSRRPLESMEVPEGTNFGGEADSSNRVEPEQKKEAYTEIFKAALAEGLDKREIKKILGLDEKQFEKIEKKVINEDGQTQISKASPYRYYEYLQRQEKCIRDLEYFTNHIDSELEFYQEMQDQYKNGAIDKMPSGRPNIQGGIMAIRAKSDILDKMVKTGQDLGIIEKRAKELRVLGNINLAALPTEELQVLLTKKMKEMGSLTKLKEMPSVYTKMLTAQVSNGEAEVINNDKEEE